MPLLAVAVPAALLTVPFGAAGPPMPGQPVHGAEITLRFEPNLGQAGQDVAFVGRGSGFRMDVRAESATLQLSAGISGDASSPTRLAMVFAGANPGAQIEQSDALPGSVHYLVGNNPRAWLTGIPTFGGVAYRQLYDGVDLRLRGERRQLILEFAIASGVETDRILIDLEGTTDIALDDAGGLVLRFGEEAWRLTRPSILQDDATEPYQADFLPPEGGRVGFALDKLGTESAVRLVDLPPSPNGQPFSTCSRPSSATAGNPVPPCRNNRHPRKRNSPS